jgi:hypothetical protein
MLLVLLERPGEDEDVAQVGETEDKSPENFFIDALKCLGGVTKGGGHEGEFE